MFNLNSKIDKSVIETLCRKYHIKKLSLFGSALKGELKPDSDIDILVEFEKNQTPGLITFCRIENELTSLIGRKVDLRTAGDLSRYFRDEVIKQAEEQYVAG